MASQQQINLSDFIKSVHQDLRDASARIGPEAAWNQHCKNSASLRKYANAMHTLATDYWEKKYEKDTRLVDRVEWVFQYTQAYFSNGDLNKYRKKEETLCERFNINFHDNLKIDTIAGNQLKLLDVGSCYNPFKVFPCFDVLAIDIAPATHDVHECDFLSVTLVKEAVPIRSFNEKIINIQENSFHIVVFSLFLEYLPSPNQRISCCEKAFNVLQPEGILVIITPDSKHVGANAKYMKSWRLMLARMGFARIRYEKLSHLHCMIFRKNLNKFCTERWVDLHQSNDLFNQFFIPQDFKRNEEKEPSQNDDKSPYINIENELPYYPSD